MKENRVKKPNLSARCVVEVKGSERNKLTAPYLYASTCAQMISFLVNHSEILVEKNASRYI
jgi:hypothetical protein